MFEQVIHKENLYRSVCVAARGKAKSREIAQFMFLMEREIHKLRHELKSGAYRHGFYKLFKIYEPKERNIAKAPFRDRVVHHAIHDVIEPVIDKRFIYDSYACRRGKGTHKAVDRAQKFLRANKYCLHGDIKKYFPSIDHGVLKMLLRKRIDDKKLFALIEHVTNSASYVFGTTGKGLPIGNLTSQFFANLYLHELDHYVKHDLKCRYYLRYMDDFLIFDDERGYLEWVREDIKGFLKETLKLRLHDAKSQVFRNSRELNFWGSGYSLIIAG